MERYSQEDLEKMLTVRAFELTILDMFSKGQIRGTTHTCIGQEYIGVSLSSFIGEKDFAISNHRGHGHFLSITGDFEALLGEFLGKEGAASLSAGGSQQLFYKNFMTTGIQGEGPGIGLGIAWAMQHEKTGALTCVFTGDGTFGRGSVYESLNIAALLRLPYVLAVENNGIAMTTPISKNMSGTIEARAKAFGVSYVKVVSANPAEIREQLSAPLQLVRDGNGPLVIEYMTVRAASHSKGDDTRPAEELARVGEAYWYNRLKAEDPEYLKKTEKRVEEKVSALIAREMEKKDITDNACAGSMPSGDAESYGNDRSAESRKPGLTADAKPEGTDQRETNLQNLNRSLKELAAEDEKLVFVGEDISEPYCGSFKAERGLQSAFPDRVVSTPISEESFTLMAAGMAVRGYRPVIDFMFSDFMTLAFDPVVNFASKFVTMYGQRKQLSMVLRSANGGYVGYGPTHSQSMQKYFFGIPNLSVYEMTPFHDNKQVFSRMFAEGRPCMFFEEKTTYGEKVFYEGQDAQKGRVSDFFSYTLKGKDGNWAVLSPDEEEKPELAILCPGGLNKMAAEAASRLLLEEEISARIYIPSRLYPCGIAEIYSELREIGRILVAEECTEGSGWGDVVLHECSVQGIEHGPVGHIMLLASRPEVIPANYRLERRMLVSEDEIFDAAKKLSEMD